MNLEEFVRRGMAAQAVVDKLTSPTPKLTVLPLDLTAEELAPIRTEAFEEAAQLHPGSPPFNREAAFKNGWYLGIREYAAAIRALAKEKPE